jgi:hypothetical protein
MATTMTTRLHSLAAALHLTWGFVWRGALLGLGGGAGLGAAFGVAVILLSAIASLVTLQSGLAGVGSAIGLSLFAAIVGAVFGAVAGLVAGVADGLATAALTGLCFRATTGADAPRYLCLARGVAVAVSLPVIPLIFLALWRPWLGSPGDAIAVLVFAGLPTLIAAAYFWRVGGKLAAWRLRDEAEHRRADERGLAAMARRPDAHKNTRLHAFRAGGARIRPDSEPQAPQPPDRALATHDERGYRGGSGPLV